MEEEYSIFNAKTIQLHDHRPYTTSYGKKSSYKGFSSRKPYTFVKHQKKQYLRIWNVFSDDVPQLCICIHQLRYIELIIYMKNTIHILLIV